MSKWEDFANGFVPAIPGRSSLLGDNSVAQALASAGYRLKNGESVVLSAPFLTTSVLHAVLRYLHVCRIEALMGQLRATWFNGPRMHQHMDLLVWTRASSQFALLRNDPELGAQIVGLNRSTGHLKQNLHNEKRLCRTIVCQQSSDLTSFCEILSEEIRPFVIVVDATPFGYRENTGELIDHLNEYFSGIPILLLGTLGDQQLECDLPKLVRKGAFWRQHIMDDTPVALGKPKARNLSLVNIPDHRLNDRLVQCSVYCRDLHQALKHHSKERKDVSAPLYKILGSLRTLVMPLSFYEGILDRRRQGGLYAVRPISDCLDHIAFVSLSTGVADNLRDLAISSIKELLAMIVTGSTGKAQALNYWLSNKRKTDTPSLIVVQSERESQYIKDWLSRDFADELSTGSLVVLGAGSVRDCSRTLHSEFKQVLVLGQLWASELWTLLLGEETYWLSYPMERHWFQRISKQVVAALQKDIEHKSEWWSFSQSPFYALPSPKSELPEEDWKPCSGQYVQYETIEINLPTDPDWISALMADVVDLPQSNAQDGPPMPSELTIETDSGAFYRYGEGQQVYVLRDDKLEHKTVGDVVEGETLVRLNGEDERCFSLVDLMIEYAETSTTEYRTFQLLVGLWHTYVDHAAYACGGIKGLHMRLKDAKINITIESVRMWSRHIGIGPRQKEVVPIMARLAKFKYTEADICSVQNAQRKIRGMHSQMGLRLRELAVATKVGFIETAGTAADVVPQDSLAELVSIEEIVSIRRHPVKSAPIVTATSLITLLKVLIENSDGRLVATQAALKSADNSLYQDLNKVRHCLRILKEDYYRVYANGKSIKLEKAIAAGKKYQIEFKGDSSSITKGKYKSTYYREYKGSKVDIGKHLGIGNSYTPQRCFRLHFHWDEQDQQIVIHHAGRHLPTSNG